MSKLWKFSHVQRCSSDRSARFSYTFFCKLRQSALAVASYNNGQPAMGTSQILSSKPSRLIRRAMLYLIFPNFQLLTINILAILSLIPCLLSPKTRVRQARQSEVNQLLMVISSEEWIAVHISSFKQSTSKDKEAVRPGHFESCFCAAWNVNYVSVIKQTGCRCSKNPSKNY